MERLSGKWYYDKDGMDWGIAAWRCSKCNYIASYLPATKNINIMTYAGTKYCPQCGDKKDGVIKDEEKL